MTDFVAIDFETANPNMASICQVGIARFQDGKLDRVWETLVNPEDYFDGMNVWVHGITEEMVIDAPKFPEIYPALKETLQGKIVACHTHFDRTAMKRVINKYGATEIDCIWLDTARVVRRAWEQFARRGYGLGNVTNVLGIEFEHHQAGEDARAAGEILLRAIKDTEISLDEWLIRVSRPITPPSPSRSRGSSHITREGNPEGPLFGEKIVFTGTLSIPRREAADLASQAGCSVQGTLNKGTTILVVGDQDIRRLVGHKRSSKHRKAEALISEGQPIRIICESDFRCLVEV